MTKGDEREERKSPIAAFSIIGDDDINSIESIICSTIGDTWESMYWL